MIHLSITPIFYYDSFKYDVNIVYILFYSI